MKKLSIFILTLATAILMVSCDGKKDESIKSEISQKVNIYFNFSYCYING